MQIIHMDPMEPIDPILPRGSYTFKHFDTVQECNHYILNNTRLSVAYTCCGGKGIAIPIKNPPTGILSHEKIRPSTKGTCDICFLEDKSLYSTCNCCKQPFCMDCLRKLPSKTCPYCRGTLNLKGLHL
jgi:hypothetical protein